MSFVSLEGGGGLGEVGAVEGQGQLLLEALTIIQPPSDFRPLLMLLSLHFMAADTVNDLIYFT